ncbi:hypothetical protein OSB04_un000956, partial [Centaurea solstitialis]
MVSPENTNWIYDYGFTEEAAVPVRTWPMQSALNNGSSSNPWGRADPGSGTSSKACREKLRRDKLNDKFVELASILEPGRPPKTDKAAILVDAVRMVTQLRTEAQKLKASSSDLQEKIKELK